MIHERYIRMYPYPRGLHISDFVMEELERDALVVGLRTEVVTITPEGLSAINKAFGPEWIHQNIAIMHFESRKSISRQAMAEARMGMEKLIKLHRELVLMDLADEMAKRIEPQPWGHHQQDQKPKEGTTP